MLGPAVPLDRAFELAGRLDVSATTSVAVVIDGADPDMWQAAMRAGVRDLLHPGRRRPR